MIPIKHLLLALASMIVLVGAYGLFTFSNRPPDAAQAKQDFLAVYPGSHVQSVELEEHEVVAISYRIRYRPFAGNKEQEVVWQYLDKEGEGWQLNP